MCRDLLQNYIARLCLIVCLPASLIMSRRACTHMLLYLHVYIFVCVCALKPVTASLRVILCNTVLVFIIISPRAFSGVQSPTRGAFGSVGEVSEAAWPRCAPSFPPPQGARHSVYPWQAKPDDEAACTANAVFELGRGLPRRAEHTRAGRHTHFGAADSR